MAVCHVSSHASTPQNKRSIPPAHVDAAWSLRVEVQSEAKVDEQRNEPKGPEREGDRVRDASASVARMVTRRSVAVVTAKTRCRLLRRCEHGTECQRTNSRRVRVEG